MSRIKLISLLMFLIFISMTTLVFADADKAYEHIYQKMDQHNSGSTLRLIESYSFPYPLGQQYTAWVYDNALAVIALLARKTPDDIQRAKLLCDTLMWVQNHDQTFSDGRIRDAYWANNINTTGHASTKDPNSSCGNLAWVIIAWMDYYMNSGDTDTTFLNNILQASIRLGNFIEAEYRDPDLGYLIGYTGWEPNQIKPEIKSTEHNIDLYVAFSLLLRVTGNTSWQGRADWARRFVTEKMWDEVQQYFYVGINKIGGIWVVNNNVAVCDNSALAQLAFTDTSMFYPALDWSDNQFYILHDGFIGFDYGFNFDVGQDNGVADGVWFEGTAQMALAYLIAKEPTSYNFYLEQLRSVQTTGSNNNGKGIISACHANVTTGFGYGYYDSLHLASTSWYIFSEQRHNPYWISLINRAPILNPIGNKAVYIGSTLSFQISASDPDGDALTYSASGLPSGATFNASTKVFSWTPSQIGTYSVTFRVVDSHSAADFETIAISVRIPPDIIIPGDRDGNCLRILGGRKVNMCDGADSIPVLE